MCTAISYRTKDHYFGRNLDLEYSYQESITVTPRNYPFPFRRAEKILTHYAMIGTATVVDGYPLYYDATNEQGLSIAALNFPGNAVYQPVSEQKDNIASFELIPWILSQCKTVSQARSFLQNINLADIAFNEQLPPSPLHFIIADRCEAIVAEPVASGLILYDDPVGILTNNPPFDFHMYHLSNYLNLTREEPVNRFTNQIDLVPYSRGMGSIGLPGDLSSASRFIKAAFTKLNSTAGESENESISQFFHILGAVEQQRGCVKVKETFEKTVYTSCCNTDKGIYYYRTYENSQISAVNMHREDLNGTSVTSYPMIHDQMIHWVN